MARARRANRPPDRDSLFGATILSAALHATVIVATFVVWPYVAPPIELAADIVPVELLEPGEETNVAPQEKVEEPPPEPPEPEQLAMEMPPPPPPEFEEPPPPPPLEDDAPTLEPEPEPEEPKPEPPKPEPPRPEQRFAMASPRAKPKPEKKKEEFDINKILSSIDEAEKKQEKTPPPAAARTVKATGAASAMTVSEIDALRSKMAKCWNVPVGAPDPAALVLRVRVFLNQDGTVASPPQLVDQGRLADPYFRAAADAAIRAVHICGPYDLPPEKYAAWNEIVITFDPRQMAGY